MRFKKCITARKGHINIKLFFFYFTIILEMRDCNALSLNMIRIKLFDTKRHAYSQYLFGSKLAYYGPVLVGSLNSDMMTFNV